jgi:WD40 repeat protein
VIHDLSGTASVIAFSDDGSRLASIVRGTLIVWDTSTGARCIERKGQHGKATCLSFQSNGAQVCVGDDYGRLTAWDISVNHPADTLSLDAGQVHGVAFSPDGQRLSGSDWGQAGIVWEIPSGRKALALKGDNILDLRFSPDGKYLAHASEIGLVLCDALTGTKVREFRGDDNAISKLAFSPDGSRLAAGGLTSSLRVWSVADGRELAATRDRCHSGGHGRVGGDIV